MKKAERDFDTAKYLLKGKKYEESSLFCQQACEKAFKSVLLNKGGKIIKTHDLLFLAERVKLPDNLKGLCKELTLMYVYTRYPDTSEIKNKRAKTQKYINFVSEVLKWIKER